MGWGSYPSSRRSEIRQVVEAKYLGLNNKTAKLSAERKERIMLPDYIDDHNRTFSIGEFLHHPSGVESMLNTKALQSFQLLDSNTYRCTLQKIEFLNFEVSPVLDLRVIPTSNDCTIEMLSCKFEGSDALEQQNNLFSAFMRNHITWDSNGPEPCLDVDVILNVALEVHTPPFNLLPLSTIEVPGNLIMQGLIDKLVPLLGQQLLKDYHNWIEQQLKLA
ncbi:hypothetical protein QJS04_geneDACA014030 [Acorus gramineus]|uniref:DUF1997 domain-containing protein n=1 Tax=Acorus gramineus TaxID=55184 RepID=A0AAV9AVP7_ACOGR|nr:hypothetical protein QJS04_geneDACA014030 [Acorus gramineus]